MKQFTTTDGKTIERLSRWIQVRTAYNMRKNNSLYDLGEDDGENGRVCSYFIWNGKKWPLCQFMLFNTFYISDPNPVFYENGEKRIISAFDCEDYSNRPLLLEVDEWGEKVRLYY